MIEANSLPSSSSLTGAELRDLWQKIILSLLPRMSKANLLTWFRNTAILDISNDGALTVGAPNAFVHGTLSRKYHADIFQVAKGLMAGVKSIEVVTDVSLNNPGDPRTFDVKSLVTNSEKRLASPQAVIRGESNGAHLLNQRYILDSYIVGENNRLAFAACRAVSANPGGAYNPLFLYGGVGLGKTHLLQAVGNAILEKFPRKKVVYITSEQFTNELINAIQNRKTNSFKERYRSIDVLIVDDIQFLANKVQTQVEFFHTFNVLYEAGKQIVISSDRPPRELKTLEDRLVSRFGMGMLVDIQSPDLETKLAILQKKCQERGQLVPSSTLEFIAHNTHGNIRELEGALTHVLAHIDLNGVVPPVADMSRLLGVRMEEQGFTATDTAPSNDEYRRKPVQHDDVIRYASELFNVTPDEITGQSRKQEFVIPRQVCMYVLRNKLNLSFEKVGEIFGGRNHTTVMHSCDKVLNDLQNDKQLVKQVNSLVKELHL